MGEGEGELGKACMVARETCNEPWIGSVSYNELNAVSAVPTNEFLDFDLSTCLITRNER